MIEVILETALNANVILGGKGMLGLKRTQNGSVFPSVFAVLSSLVELLATFWLVLELCPRRMWIECRGSWLNRCIAPGCMPVMLHLLLVHLPEIHRFLTANILGRITVYLKHSKTTSSPENML